MFNKRLTAELDARFNAGLVRNPILIDKYEGKYVYVNGQKLINFASNDYLGLASLTKLRKKIAANFNNYPASSSSSRLVSGNNTLINKAEQACAQYFGYEDALFFPSGFQANLGLLSTLFDERDCVVYDKHIHASLIKGLALCDAKQYGYNHSDYAHLEKRLKKIDNDTIVLISESLFSMDGDLLNCEVIAQLKKQYGLYAVIDEAHSFGVMGDKGRGLARGISDIAVGTFGKAFGLFGAFILLPPVVKQYLLNFSAAQMYTTALPPAHAASVIDILEEIEQSDNQRQLLAQISREMKQQLLSRGFVVSGDAHILTVKIGDEKTVMLMAEKLRDAGLFVLAARYPTVSYGKSILRISMNAQMDEKDIASFCVKLSDLGNGEK